MLLGVEGEAREIVEKYNAGIAFEPENKMEFLDALDQIVSSEEKYRLLQKGCSKLAEAFDRQHLAHQMLDVLKKVQERNKSEK